MGRFVRTAAIVAALVAFASGCMFFPAAVRNAHFPSEPTPWWCTSDTGGELPPVECQTLSAQLDAALNVAHAHPHAADALGAGATATPYVAGVGAGFELSAPTATFSPGAPDTILYDGTGTGAQVVGLEWNVEGAAAPAGFTGANDTWLDAGGDVWTLRAWVVRPFENHSEPFASTHPCLGTTNAVYDVGAPCYTATHERPLEILVTNDDGFGAPGIDAAVEALRVIPNVHVTVVAPATNQSGTGDRTTPGGVTGTPQQTASGYPAFAVNGFPADSVLHATRVLGLNPDLVVSGINEGQNIGPLADLSGTVGAARVAGRSGIPSLASSQGFGTPPDFPVGAVAVVTWVQDFLLGRAGPPFQEVANLNVPTCTAGEIRGTVEVPLATATNGRPLHPSDCTSTVTTLVDDIDGFINGFITLSDAGLH
jgi:5'-nucleotidase